MIVILFTLLLASAAAAQSLSGDLHDPADAAIANAKIRVVNQQTGAAQSTLSNEGGAFLVPSLSPGDYRIEVEAPGFQKLVRGPLSLEVGQTLALHFTLQLGPS